MSHPLARILLLVLSAIAAVVCVFYLWLGTLHLSGLVGSFRFSPAVVGFEAIALLAAAMGVAGSLSVRWRAVGLATACIAGAIATTAVLSFLDLRENVASGMQQPLRMGVAVRLSCGVGIAALGALDVLLRRKRSLLDLAAAAGFLLPPMLVAALVATRGFTWLGMHEGDQEPSTIAVLLITLIGLVLLVCVSGGTHMLIRAFERGTRPVVPGDTAGERTPEAAAIAE